MNDVQGGNKPRLDCSHPDEIARRKAIHKYYDDLVAVNLGGANQSVGEGYSPGGVCSGRA